MSAPTRERLNLYIEALNLPEALCHDPRGAGAVLATMTVDELRATIIGLCALVSAAEYDDENRPMTLLRAILVADWTGRIDESPDSGE